MSPCGGIIAFTNVLRAHADIYSTALEASALTYLKAHFTDGVTAVFTPRGDSTHYVIQVVANKYNPTNFW